MFKFEQDGGQENVAEYESTQTIQDGVGTKTIHVELFTRLFLGPSFSLTRLLKITTFIQSRAFGLLAGVSLSLFIE